MYLIKILKIWKVYNIVTKKINFFFFTFILIVTQKTIQGIKGLSQQTYAMIKYFLSIGIK